MTKKEIVRHISDQLNLSQQDVKKVFFLEIDTISTTGKITKERVEQEVAGITEMKLNKSAFLEMLANDEAKTSTVYEILKEWF